MRNALILIAATMAVAFARDPASVAAELRSIGQHPGAPVPAAWIVDTPEGHYSIPSEPLRKLNPDQSRAWLSHLAAELDGYATKRGDTGPARSELKRILAREEFAGVGPPSAWDLFRQRIQQWIARTLGRLFAFASRHSAASQFLFWFLLAAVAGAVIVWMIVFWMRGDPIAVTVSGTPQETRSVNEWIAAAREAAEKGDLPRAIQCAYWAGIARLQETGMLPRDRTRTPREYLRLLAQPRSGAEALAGLTARLERFWYARQAAGPVDFDECMRSLEALGCSLD